MTDWSFAPVAAVLVGVVAIVLSLGYLIDRSEKNDLAAFHVRCVAAGETPAKCDILAEIKRSADDARTMAAFSVGYSSSRR